MRNADKGVLGVIVFFEKNAQVPIFKEGNGGIGRRAFVNGFLYRPAFSIVCTDLKGKIFPIGFVIGIDK